MGFADEIETKTLPIREAILGHPFVTGVGDGTLDVEKFKFYVRQDYLYLIDYSRVLALASSRAPDLEAQSWFARLLHETLNTEMGLHRSYCAKFGVTREDLEATEPAPTTVSYTSFLLNVAHQGTYQELAASLLPCQWGYWEIGDNLSRQGPPENAPLYAEWIAMYSSPEYKELADWARTFADGLGTRSTEEDVRKMEAAYVTSLRYERLFWDMAYNLEQWPL